MFRNTTGAAVPGLRRTALTAAAVLTVPAPLPSAGTAQAEVLTFTAATALDGRTVKDPDVPVGRQRVSDRYLKGDSVSVVCQDTGPRYGGRTVWDLTTDGLWVPDTYLRTGTDGFVPGLPRCDTDGIRPGQAPGGVHGRTTGPAGPVTGTAAEKVQRVIDAARSRLGKGHLHSWGAGGKGGPSYGVHHYPDDDPSQGDDYHRFGYDCPSLTLHAFRKGAGVGIGAWTGAQHTKGRAVPIASRKPGDLVFQGRSGNDSDATTHVALHPDGDKILEAAPPRDGHSVRISDLTSQGTPYSEVRRIFG